MTKWIQYHNCDLQGHYPSGLVVNDNLDVEAIDIPASEGERSSIYTKKGKTAYQTIGKLIYLIMGIGKPKKYFLWSKIEADKVIPRNNGYFTVEGNCTCLQHPIRIDTLRNFKAFKRFCGNFGIGLQNITKHPFAETLESLFSDDSFTMKIPDPEQYKSAISNLKEAQISILKTIYSCPNASATAKELAQLMNWRSFHAANRNVGEIGKQIAQFLNWKMETYYDHGERPAYFRLVGNYTIDTGWTLWRQLQQALEELTLVNKDYKEGKVILTSVNRFERDTKAREECIRIYGYKCFVCGFDFEKVYGDVAKHRIEVHHLIPLSQIRKNYSVNPEMDMRPVCSNCHSVIHLRTPPYSIDELKQMLNNNTNLK